MLARADADGNLMVVVVNHDSTNASYRLFVDREYVEAKLPKDALAWNVLENRLIETHDARLIFRVDVAPEKVAVLFIGSPKALEPVKKAQAELDAMDLSVPAYFRDRPALNEGEYGTPVPAP